MRNGPLLAQGRLLLAGLVLLGPVLAAADEGPSSPAFDYHLSLAGDVTVLALSGAGLLVPTAFQSQWVHPSCPCRSSSVNALDRSVIGNHSSAADTASNVSVLAFAVLPVCLDLLDVGWGASFLKDTVVYGEAIAVSGAMVTVTKTLVQRPRPYQYQRNTVGSAQDYVSFYSGHTALAFSALSAATMTYVFRHGRAVWPWVVTFLLGASVAAERVLAGKHFYTDVAVGAASGAAAGVLVPWLHAPDRSWQVSASASPGGGMLTLGRVF